MSTKNGPPADPLPDANDEAARTGFQVPDAGLKDREWKTLDDLDPHYTCRGQDCDESMHFPGLCRECRRTGNPRAEATTSTSRTASRGMDRAPTPTDPEVEE